MVCTIWGVSTSPGRRFLGIVPRSFRIASHGSPPVSGVTMHCCQCETTPGLHQHHPLPRPPCKEGPAPAAPCPLLALHSETIRRAGRRHDVLRVSITGRSLGQLHSILGEEEGRADVRAAGLRMTVFLGRSVYCCRLIVGSGRVKKVQRVKKSILIS